MIELLNQIEELGFRSLPHSSKHYFIGIDYTNLILQVDADYFVIECLVTGRSFVGNGNVTIEWIKKELENMNAQIII